MAPQLILYGQAAAVEAVFLDHLADAYDLDLGTAGVGIDLQWRGTHLRKLVRGAGTRGQVPLGGCVKQPPTMPERR